MPKSYVVIDKRVGKLAHGGPTPKTVTCPGLPGKPFFTDEKTDAGAVFDDLLKDLGGDRIQLLTLLAHGYYDASTSMEGLGIQFGKDDIEIGNVGRLFGRFRGRFQSKAHGIELIGCSVAGAEVFSPAQQRRVCIAGGTALCQFIADTAGTAVRASPDVQDLAQRVKASRLGHKYVDGRMVPDEAATDVEVDPGPWEGRVWNFYPGKPDWNR